MLVIRQEQTEVFRRESLERFEKNAVRHLRAHLSAPTEGYTDEKLRRRIRDCIPRATSYGLASEQHVMCFVDTTFLLGETFDSDATHAWAAILLTDKVRAADEKATILLKNAAHFHNAQPLAEKD